MIKPGRKTLLQRLNNYTQQVEQTSDLKLTGRLVRIVGLTIEAVGCQAPLGSSCLITNDNGKTIEAEVVGFSNNKLYLMSTASMHGLSPGAIVTPIKLRAEVGVGDLLLGRVIDGQGNPLDGKGEISPSSYYPLHGKFTNPMDRECISQPLDVGIRAINGLLSIGRGQRIGLFAGSGVGKSVLLGMMTCFTSADVVVVGLIGERGREVKEFIKYNLGSQGLGRSVVVASPADTSPLMRIHGANRAMAIAEYFRDQGAQVLLLFDSLTRFAQAQRELGLAIGEPSTSKGYPPSVFSRLSKLVERAGNGVQGGGSITAFYTVLVEGDDTQEPVADAARSFLDGHIVLSRMLAESGHYPAIDIEASISRVMPAVVNKEHAKVAHKFRQLLSKYEQNRDLVTVGAYKPGNDLELDQAIAYMPRLQQYLRQDVTDYTSYSDSINQLTQLFTADEQTT